MTKFITSRPGTQSEHRTLHKRTVFKLVIGNHARRIECRDWAEAIRIKNMLVTGRTDYSLTEEYSVER